MSKPNTKPSPSAPLFRQFDLDRPVPTQAEVLAGRRESQVLLLMMQAAAEVAGRDAAFAIWDAAAELSAFSYDRKYRLAWTSARSPFGNHAPNAIDRHNS
jgi:hypothetical protein